MGEDDAQMALIGRMTAVEFLGATTGPCPAMEFDAGRFWCGLVRNSSSYLDMPAFGDPVVGAIFAQALGVDRGCDSDAPRLEPKIASSTEPRAPVLR